MPKAVIEDWGRFRAFLASQPSCQWSAQKEQEIAMGIHHDHRRAGIRPPPPKNDNAELADALSSMA
jgi:hypothetical protein